MKIIATILLSSLLFFNCATFNEVKVEEFQPSRTNGCVQEMSSSARLKCFSKLLKSFQNEKNARTEFKQSDLERIDWQYIYVNYSYCSVDNETDEVYECLNHKTKLRKPTLGYYIYDYSKPVVGFLIGYGVALL